MSISRHGSHSCLYFPCIQRAVNTAGDSNRIELCVAITFRSYDVMHRKSREKAALSVTAPPSPCCTTLLTTKNSVPTPRSGERLFVVSKTEDWKSIISRVDNLRLEADEEKGMAETFSLFK